MIQRSMQKAFRYVFAIENGLDLSGSREFMILNKFKKLMMDSFLRVSIPTRTIDPIFSALYRHAKSRLLN